MKLAHYGRDSETRVGLVHDHTIYPIHEAVEKLSLPFSADMTIDRLLSDEGLQLLQQAEDKIVTMVSGIPVDKVKLHSPILNPEKILLMAVNYSSHSKEGNVKPPAAPYLFTKFRNALIGPDDPILIPRVSAKVDWEVELGVVIGKRGKYIAKDDAMSYVAGYLISNDISFRDYQFDTQLPDGKTTLGLNWVKGKGLDSSFPIGPWLVTKDEIEDPHGLEISLSVNGKAMQRSNTRDMIFKIDSIIEYASAGMTLKPGDIISTGTPRGVAFFTGEPFLKDGDIVEGTVNKIGTLRNPVKAE